jgi:2-amino-4-hydroxy-6-hydroxymethyldihydropteridine diphosphokinase
VSVAELSALRAGDEVAGVYACTRKDRLTARTGSPYLALELRDRTSALPARVFRDADLLGGRFDRGDLVRVQGRVERFRDELQVEVRSIERAEAADPAAFLPVAYRDLDELDGFLEHLAREVHEPGYRALLETLLGIEARCGRTRPHPGAARTLDLDLILYGDQIIEERDLIVPHPRFRERRFVIEPLAEIAPDWIDPVTKRTMRELMSGFLPQPR